MKEKCQTDVTEKKKKKSRLLTDLNSNQLFSLLPKKNQKKMFLRSASIIRGTRKSNPALPSRERADSKDSKLSKDSKSSKDSKVSKDSKGSKGKKKDKTLERDMSKRSSKSFTTDGSGSKTPEKRSSKRSSRKLSRKGSKLAGIFFTPKKLPAVEITDSMIRLETLVQSEKLRGELVQRLVVLPGDFVVKLRFCAAVDHFDNASDKDDQKNLANTIIETFLNPNSMFKISLNEDRREAIVSDGMLNQLLEAKREILEEMTRNPEVMKIVDSVESMD